MEDRPSTTKKIGGSKVIHSQTREVITNVYHFMKREAKLNAPINLKKVQERVVQATGVSKSSLRRILREEKQINQVGTSFSTPNKVRNQKKFGLEIDQEFKIFFSVCKQIKKHFITNLNLKKYIFE